MIWGSTWAQLIFEASSREVFGKDVEGNDIQGDFMLGGGTYDPCKSLNAFAMTDDVGPTRLIVEVQNPADEAIPAYVHEHDYDTDSSQLDAGRATYLLKVVAALVMAVGLLISALSFYILMLSIYLLVEKNTTKLQNLLLIGYTATRVSLPYQILALGMNLAVFLLALTLLYVLRGHYLELLWQMFPQMSEGPVMPAIVVGGTLFILVSVVNIVAVRHKINSVNRPS